MGYAEAIQYLYGLQKHGIKLGLETPRRLLREFNNPQGVFRTVHVAGTNGKGSTAAMLAAMLRQAGRRTGLFTSPHLVSFTERISVDGRPIPKDDVVALAEEIQTRTADMQPTFFEVVTVMGLLHFKRARAEWSVVETGLGGRLDATNVLVPAVSVITTLGLDHREFLGDSSEDIAREKAGIIKEGTPVVSECHGPAEMTIIEEAARRMGAPLHVAGSNFSGTLREHGPEGVVFDYRSDRLSLEGLRVPLAGEYQTRNAALAIRALELAQPEAATAETVREALAGLRWPGRLERIAENPATYIDGAHNPGAAAALARTLSEDYLGAGRGMVLVMGVMGDKDVEGILGPLLPLAREVIFAAPAYGRSAPADRLITTAKVLGHAARTAPSVADAFAQARELARAGEMVLVTGSFFTIGEALEAAGAEGFLTGLREWQPSG